MTLLALATLAGCARAPSPLTPAWRGSIGTPNRGVLVEGAELRRDADGLRWLRGNDRHWGLPRFTAAIERAAARVARERPGSRLTVGDLSAATGGGPLSGHLSHRSGLDADLLLYVTTLGGAPVDSPGFLRFDVEREWLLVRALMEDPQARVQWIFVSDVVQALLLEWATARGDSPEIVRRAQSVMHQPHPGGVHDDHIHVRTSCSTDEMVAGCDPIGPRRPWLATDATPPPDGDRELALALLRPLVGDPAK